MSPDCRKSEKDETQSAGTNAFQRTNSVAADTSFVRRNCAPPLSGRMKHHRYAPEREQRERARRADLPCLGNLFLLRECSLVGLPEQSSPRSREVRRIRISFSRCRSPSV